MVNNRRMKCAILFDNKREVGTDNDFNSCHLDISVMRPMDCC